MPLIFFKSGCMLDKKKKKNLRRLENKELTL